MRRSFYRAAGVFLVISGTLVCADPVRAVLARPSERTGAPELKLRDQSGQAVNLSAYRGQVVLLDFWATWCGGCKQELPWFEEFEAKYRSQRFAVIAVSMNEEGWPVVKPFIDSVNLRLKVVLDDGSTSKRYGFKTMPAAYLIDRNGRVAAEYFGLVDRTNMETNIKLLLAEPNRK